MGRIFLSPLSFKITPKLAYYIAVMHFQLVSTYQANPLLTSQDPSLSIRLSKVVSEDKGLSAILLDDGGSGLPAFLAFFALCICSGSVLGVALPSLDTFLLGWLEFMA